MSKASKRSFAKLWCCRILNFLLMYMPVFVCVVIGYANPDLPTGAAVCLTGSLVIAAVLGLINIILKYRLRCCIWILILGLYIALDNILPIVLVLAFTTIIDDLVLTPLVDRFKSEYIANRAMDRRGVADVA